MAHVVREITNKVDRLGLFSTQDELNNALSGDYAKVYTDVYAERVLGSAVFVCCRSDGEYTVRRCIPFLHGGKLVESDGTAKLALLKGETLFYLMDDSASTGR